MGKGPGLGWPCQLWRLPGPEDSAAGGGGQALGMTESQESQVLRATKPWSLATAEKACGLGSNRPSSGLSSLRHQVPAWEHTRGCACTCKHTCAQG